MNKFAFIIHPNAMEDVHQKFPMTKYVPDFFWNKASQIIPPSKVSEVKGIHSAYNEVKGDIISCPFTSQQFLDLSTEVSIRKIIKAVKLAERNGAEVVGLGAMTSVIGEGGRIVAQNVGIPVTTGNSFTVFTALEGTKRAVKMRGIDWLRAKVVVLGAMEGVGKVCTRIIAKESRYLTLVARQQNKLEKLAAKILYETGLAVKITRNLKAELRKADVVIAITSALDTMVEPEDLKPGSVVCDVVYPRNISRMVAEKRKDVLVINEGVVDVPGDLGLNNTSGFLAGKYNASMAETIILALEKKYESYSLGKDMTIEQVEEMGSLAHKHGIKLVGF